MYPSEVKRVGLWGERGCIFCFISCFWNCTKWPSLYFNLNLTKICTISQRSCLYLQWPPPVKMNRVNGSFWKIGTAVRVSGPHWGIKTYILLWRGINAETEESLSKIPVRMLKHIFGGSESKKLEEVAPNEKSCKILKVMIVECETTVGAVNSRKNIAENLVKCIEIVQLFFYNSENRGQWRDK